jgi:hypothetical protein
MVASSADEEINWKMGVEIAGSLDADEQALQFVEELARRRELSGFRDNLPQSLTCPSGIQHTPKIFHDH